MKRALLSLLLLGTPALAQGGDGGELIAIPYWVDTPTGAEEALGAAIQAAANRHPERAARALQRVFDRYAVAFVKQSGRLGGFVGARSRATQLLSHLGTDVRRAYDSLYAGAAEERLRQAVAAGDAVGLRDVIRRYEATPAGLTAVIALADHALQRGHPAEARLLLARIPTLHADAFARIPALRERLRHACELDFAAGGPPVPDAEEPAPEGNREDVVVSTRAWPMIGGNATRTRRAGAIRERPGNRIADPEREPAYMFPLRAINERYSDVPIQPDRGFGSIRGQRAAREWRMAWRDYLPLAPSIARGRLVYLDGQQLVARNLYSGDEIWRWPQGPFPTHKGRTNISQIFSPTIVDGTVYAAIEVRVPWRAQQLQNVPITYYIPQRRLVALDLETGAVRWAHRDPELRAAAQRTGREPDPRLKKLSVVGVPLVRGDRIYVPVAYTEGTIHTHLMAVDRHTGEIVYVTRISSGQQELNLFGRQLQELVTTPVAEIDGQILFGTNLGLVCAVDAVLGTPLWARTYRIREIPSTYLWFEAPRRWPVLDNGAPLIVRNQVIVSPTDGNSVLAIERGSGRVLWEFAARNNVLGFAVKRMHGTDGERLFLGGDRGVIALWLRSGEDGNGSHEAGQRAWTHEFGADEQGAGHGVVADDGLWIPTYGTVLRLDPATGEKLEGSFEREGKDQYKRVQLVAGEGALVAAARDFITVRYRRDDVLRLALEAIRRDPRAAEPRLDAADIHLAVGDFDAAARFYREALERSRRFGANALGRRARSGLHHALLRGAFRLLEQEPDRARGAFDSAFKAAPTPARELDARRSLEGRLAERKQGAEADWRLQNLRHVEARFGTRLLDKSGRTVRGWSLRRTATIHELRGDARRAVADLQKLLEQDPMSADAAIASEEIGRILRRAGRKMYEPYERRANNLFVATLKSGNLDALERGLRIYANAEAAPDATLRLANRRLQAGETARAAALLQRFLVDRPHVEQTAPALRLLFRAFHARKAYGPAFAVLQRLRRSHATARLTRPDGATIGAVEWADRWLAKEPYATLRRSARRRDLEPPLIRRFERSFDGAFVDVPDLLGQQTRELRDAVFVRLGNQIVAIDTRSGSEKYRLAFGGRPLGPLVLAGNRLFGVSARHLHVFDAVKGDLLARHDMPFGDTGVRLLEHRGQVFLLTRARRERGTMRVTALDPERGGTLWSRSIPRLPSGERYKDRDIVAQADRLVLFSTDRAHITVLNTSSGAIENRIPIEAQGGAYSHSAPLALPDGTILAAYKTTQRVRSRSAERSYTLLLIDPSRSGREAIVWRYRPAAEGRFRRLAHVQVIGDYVVVLESSGGGLASLLRLRDGHLVVERKLSEIVGSRVRLAGTQPMSHSLLLLLTLGDGGAPPRLIGIEPPRLTLRYSLELAADSDTRPAAVPSDGVVTLSLEPVQGVQGELRFQLIDPLNARRVQEIRPGVREAKWFTSRVQNGHLLVTFANRVLGYGPK